MNCPYCRNEIQQGVNSCPHCGKYLGGQFSAGAQQQARATVVSGPVDQATAIDRAEFIRKTYTHVALSVLAFIILESILLNWSGAINLVLFMVDGYNWLIVLGAFMFISHFADKWARTSTSKETQYMGLGLYIVAEAFIFLPILFIANHRVGQNIIGSAGLVTLGLFAGLTFVVLTTKKDFSFLEGALKVGFFIAMGVIVASILMGFNLGLLFSAIMVVFAAGAILYTTSNVLHHYRTDQYVAASLSLFASVMLLFWYILRIFLAFDD
jgi:FtsH-binding integral membrane protein